MLTAGLVYYAYKMGMLTETLRELVWKRMKKSNKTDDEAEAGTDSKSSQVRKMHIRICPSIRQMTVGR